MQFINRTSFLKVSCPQNLRLHIVHMDKTHNLRLPGALRRNNQLIQMVTYIPFENASTLISCYLVYLNTFYH